LGVEEEVGKKLLKCIEIESSLMLRPIGILRREAEPLTPAVASFIRLMEDACKSRKTANRK
jgi:hypothetical protein